jgi:hypothetical protein
MQEYKRFLLNILIIIYTVPMKVVFLKNIQWVQLEEILQYLTVKN